MCRVITISSQKGGVGKTATCINLGIGLARAGKKVLLVETDAQGNLAASLGIDEPDELEITLANLMEKGSPEISRPERMCSIWSWSVWRRRAVI